MTKNSEVSVIIDVYDPALCCSTGVCGPELDDGLADFANDVKWMKSQGIVVKRYNLGQEPQVFKSNTVVLSKLKKEGSDILPIIFVNGEMVSEGGYPDRNQLMEWLPKPKSNGLNGVAGSSDQSDQILSEIEHAVTKGDENDLRVLFHKGEALRITTELLIKAMQEGINNRQRITQSILQTAHKLLGIQPGGCAPGGGCC